MEECCSSVSLTTSLCYPARKIPDHSEIEPGTSQFQIRQTLYSFAIKASSYSKAV
ncbi:hypothetical protein DPMN_026956 [Dreissena polymorpha]|uniref:Uncharacterized protein n=1 Tax=Dreissena polymorpha TaxID=45954 RepID=A0A9D4LSL5_DREPO|nr:hypothetical protein DPMN_026956 [Dreissena polymorpha]